MSKKRISLISILFVLFILDVVLIKLNLTGSFDEFIHSIFIKNINDRGIKIFSFITFFGSTIYMVSLSVLLFVLFLILKKKNIAFTIAGAIIGSTILNNVIKVIVRRARPVLEVHVVEKTFSFPSGHTMASVTMYGFISYLIIKSNINKYLKILLVSLLTILTMFILFSRVYLGAHFITDIIGGILVSTIWLLVYTNLVKKYLN